MLVTLPDPSLETRLRLVRTRIELRRPDNRNDIDTLARHHPGDWRVDWYRGLWSLVNREVKPAGQAFSNVLEALPGETAPKLALALCAACAGDNQLAEHGYATVWQTDLSYVSAAFGLARARFALGDLAGTAAAMEAVPESSRYAVTARLCAIRARVRGCARGQSPVADFFTTAEKLAILDLDDHRRALAIAEVLETVLDWESAHRPWAHGTRLPDALLGHQLNEHGVRDGLERTYRKLARLAPTAAERITYVDKANEYRNRSWI